MPQSPLAAGGHFDSRTLMQRLRRLAPRPDPVLHCMVALSGGLDSVVLLHALVRARAQFPGQLSLRAVHVDHHLQEAAPRFRKSCRSLARRLKVPLKVRDAPVRVPRGGSIEEAARMARYNALREQLRPGELLLTAQHADDQLETVLLALLRGAGPAGLAAMPAAMAFGAGWLLRPLLAFSRSALADYAAAEHLAWIEDPTNADHRFDRNYLRAVVVPRMRERWPSIALTAARSARHCSEAAGQIGLLAQRDLDLASDGFGLEVAVLRRWNRGRQKAALRHWMARQGVRALDERRLDEVLRMLDARQDAVPMLSWPGTRLRRNAGRLTLELLGSTASSRQAVGRVEWDWRRPLALPGGGKLAVRADVHGDLDLDRLPTPVFVSVGAVGDRGGRRLRKLLQELKVPSWQRDALPLVYERQPDPEAGGAAGLLAIGDLWLADSLGSDRGTSRRGRIVWRDRR